MKHMLSLVAAAVLCVSAAVAQTAAQANDLFANKDYQKAEAAYANLVRQQPKNPLYQYRYARCLYENKADSAALVHFALSGDKYALTNYYKGEIFMHQYRFDEAAEAFRLFLPTVKDDEERVAMVKERMRVAEVGSKLMKRVQVIEVIDSIAVAKADFLDAYNLPEECGWIVADEEGAVEYKNQLNDLAIYAYKEADGFRLYEKKRLLSDWTQPEALFPKATCELNYPFMLSDGMTLFFGIKDKAGMGGWDIYVTAQNPNTGGFVSPENIGFPFNSEANDYMLAVDELRGIGYFATDRYSNEGEVMVYRFVWNEEKTIARNMAADKVRSLAQMRGYAQSQLALAQMATPPDEETAWSANYNPMEELHTRKTKDFEFTISDGVVYTNVADFNVTEAKVTFLRYQKAEAQQAEDLARLEQLRKQYASNNEEQPVEISQEILRLERRTYKAQRELQNLANRVRKLELGEL